VDKVLINNNYFKEKYKKVTLVDHDHFMVKVKFHRFNTVYVVTLSNFK
jgi:hypothetical protein